jgi:hypothetical protein
MSNCVWPSTVWQTYDYYMEGTGSMYGSQKGAEPIHVQYYSPASSSIQVFNNTMSPLSNYTVSATTYNLDGSQAWKNSQAISSIPADGSANSFAVTAGTSTPYFLDLKLKDASGKVVSKNFYWLPISGSSTSAMMSMGKATIVQSGAAVTSKNGVENTITCKVVNTSAVCAVACRLMLTRTSSGARILPVHFNENYFSLAPGDTQSITVQYDDVDAAGDKAKLSLTGINVTNLSIAVPTRRSETITRSFGTYAKFAGTNFKVCDVPVGYAWRLTVLDMQGRTIMNTSGISKGSVESISAATLLPGVYVATLFSASERNSSMIVKSAQAGIR